MAHELVLLLLGERTALGDGGQPGHDVCVFIVVRLLFGVSATKCWRSVRSGNSVSTSALAPAQHVGRDALVQPVQIAVAARAARAHPSS